MIDVVIHILAGLALLILAGAILLGGVWVRDWRKDKQTEKQAAKTNSGGGGGPMEPP